MKLVQNWKRAWRWYSIRWSAAGFVLTSLAASLALAGGAAAWSMLYDETVVLVLAALIFAASMVGRLIQQEEASNGRKNDAASRPDSEQ